MQVTVKRYGGIMAMKPKEKISDVDRLDTETRNAVKVLVETPPASGAARAPDGFIYSFEILEEGKPLTKVEISGQEVPEALRKLLP